MRDCQNKIMSNTVNTRDLSLKMRSSQQFMDCCEGGLPPVRGARTRSELLADRKRAFARDANQTRLEIQRAEEWQPRAY